MTVRGLPPLWRESRVPRELAFLRRHPVFAGVGVPHGDGQPVLLIPGFMAGDGSLATMTHWLRRLGYRTSRAGIRANVDCSTAALTRLEPRLEALAERAGEPVAIVGQSRGGAFAHALALRRPDLVSGIVTLGSPLADPLAVHPLVRLNVTVVGLLGSLRLPGMFTRDCLEGDCCAELRELTQGPFPRGVGFVSVYSRSDGVVRWRACLHPDAEHVEVRASHIGMAVHAGTYRAVARALASFAEPVPLRSAA